MKFFFSFLVVCCHYWRPADADPYPVAAMLRLIGVAVPVFVVASFFLTAKIYIEQDAGKMKKRLWRLAFPYVAWGVLYFAGYFLIDLLIKTFSWKDGLRLEISYRDLLWQLGLGSSEKLCPQLWYQFVMLVMTLVIWFLFKMGKKITPYVLLGIATVMLFLQYSGLNFKAFGAMRYEMRYPLGRLCEMFPFVCFGIFLALGLMKILSKQRIITCVVSLAAMVIIGIFKLFNTMPESFTYGGIFALVYGTLAFLFFYTLPFEKLPDFIRICIRFLAKYSFGIYCIHYGVGYCWNAVICRRFGWKSGSFVACCAIYLISLLAAYVISRIPGKYSKQLVE